MGGGGGARGEGVGKLLAEGAGAEQSWHHSGRIDIITGYSVIGLLSSQIDIITGYSVNGSHGYLRCNLDVIVT